MATITLLPLFEPLQLASAASPLFTATAPIRIDKLTVTNTDTAAHTVSFYWVSAGGAFSVANLLVAARPLQVNESWDAQPFMGHVLSEGDQLFGMASVGGVVNCFGSGVQVSP